MEVYAPNRALAEKERATLLKLEAKRSRADKPLVLALADLREAPALFQPRHDSIAYAPGRSEAHIASLARAAAGGNDLDPLTIIAFGPYWFLVDGHHRRAAYASAGRQEPVPVNALVSDLRGADRVAWAIDASFADNRKNRLNISATDKVDGAWRAVAQADGRSKRVLAKAYDVSESIVAEMRRTKRELDERNAYIGHLHRWAQTRGELAHLKNGEGTGDRGEGWDTAQRKLAMRLKPVMEMRPSPGQLAAVLEQFEPGIVQAMALAPADDGGPDLDD